MTLTDPRISNTWAVVLNWNQPAMTIKCVQSLLAQTNPLRVLVVDNGSTPPNREALRNGLSEDSEYLQNAKNLGFAGGMNSGILYALEKGAEFVWLMNNDAFPDPQCLVELLKVMIADTKIAAATPSLYYSDGRPQCIGGKIDWKTGELILLMSGELECPTPVGVYATGAALLVRAEAIRRHGVLDTRFFAYWEETDLCTRFVRLGSWNLAEVPSARCIHLEGVSTGGGESPLTTYLLTRNRFLYIRNHLPIRWLMPVMLKILAESIVATSGLQRRGFQKAVDASLVGIYDAVRNRYGPPSSLIPHPFLSRAFHRGWWPITRILQSLARVLAIRGSAPLKFSRRWVGDL
jgi:GT2 family glycosyltransferase